MDIIMDEYEVKNIPMISGTGEISKRVFRIVEGKDAIWLISTDENAGDFIYARKKDDAKSEGFGGSTLEFLLEDGSMIKLQGPWHSNSVSLYHDTGIDLNDKHKTFGLVALNRKGNKYKDILFIDSEPVIGIFDRIEQKAQEIANELNDTVLFYSKSQDGSHAGSMKPTTEGDLL